MSDEMPTPEPRESGPRRRRSRRAATEQKPTELQREVTSVDGNQLTSRRKLKNARYSRLRLDENDLWRMAAMAQALANQYGGTVKIEIVSADEEDTVESTDPAVFLRNDIPNT